MKGRVVKWIENRGFGFIAPDDGSKDVYVHARDLPSDSSLEEGRTVEFDFLDDGRGKQKAVNIDGDGLVRAYSTIAERRQAADDRRDRDRDRDRDRRSYDRGDDRYERRRRDRSEDRHDRRGRDRSEDRHDRRGRDRSEDRDRRRRRSSSYDRRRR